jgi:hypothetical protein
MMREEESLKNLEMMHAEIKNKDGYFNKGDYISSSDNR